MACVLRIAGRCLRWNIQGTLSCVRSLTDGGQVLSEVKVDESKELDNKVTFGGIVVGDFDGNHVTVKYGQTMVKVLPKPKVSQDFAKVKKDMNIIIRGQLSQKSVVTERNGRFRYERINYISAQDIQFVNYEQSTEKNDAEESAIQFTKQEASSTDSEKES